MPTSVLLEPGCCPAGSGAAAALERAGGKSVVVAPRPGAGLLRDDGSLDADGWPWRVADVVGLPRAAVTAGCPVPLADAATTWARVAEELAEDRWDAVVVPSGGARAAELVEGPGLLLRVLDARLQALAPSIGDDPRDAASAAGLLDLRPGVAALAAVAAGVTGLGSTVQHARHGCRGTAVLGLPRVSGPGAAPEPTTGVRPDGAALLWWLELPGGADPDLHQEGDALVVGLEGVRRTFRLPAALTRCRVVAATVVADRLEVRFEPDPDAWR
ncbi:hypothetical protein [Aquipuribacter sp. MA13-6]|uniref:hypothetical protein n=1 Tax=unclassified Aquipuribacter TaxID=2635084 RepID=UPI003EEE7A97